MSWPLWITHSNNLLPLCLLRHWILLAAKRVCEAEQGPAEAPVRVDVRRRRLLCGCLRGTEALQQQKLHCPQRHRWHTTYLLQVQEDEWKLRFKVGVDQGPFPRTPEGRWGGCLREVPQGGQTEEWQDIWEVRLYTPPKVLLGELTFLTGSCTENYVVFLCIFVQKNRSWDIEFCCAGGITPPP